MRPHPRIIGYLTRALEHELNAVHQYQTRAALTELWGMPELAAHYRQEAAQELVHAERLTRQLLLIGIAPTALSLTAVRPGRDPDEMAQLSAEMEGAAVQLYDDACQFCRIIRDQVHFELFQSLLQEEYAHFQQYQSSSNH
ncbi:bacterioferritin [Halothiobacillus sp. DCM-1]|uniref:ferritin-like domain-containing protein n=1 Tax=Halothiobacillus sp. DCM-1 TaxID=3112558 RepID=UPI00324E3D2A